MHFRVKLMGVVLLCAVGLCVCWAQGDYRHAGTSNDNRQSTAANQGRTDGRTLTDDDRLSIIAAALDARVVRSERDCSHLVHAIYQQAGFPYSYAPSSEIYARAESFVRVKQPQPGDLVVWRGHVGIVIKPSQHIFFSLMRSGPGVDDYESPYWKSRGRPRFYRYTKNSLCAGCNSDDH
jgi:cell wall-associated NlpC family hydrolase